MYGDRFKKILLYVSFARADFHEDSDIDMLVVIKDEADNGSSERNKLSSLMMDLVIDYSHLLVPKPMKESKYNDADSVFFVFFKKGRN